MNNATATLLAAERLGRASAIHLRPKAGEIWRIDALPDDTGCGLLAAARWAARLGAKVAVRLSSDTTQSAIWNTLAESSRRQALTVADHPGRKSSLWITRDGLEREVPALPDTDSVWRHTLAESAGFVDAVTDGTETMTCAECRAIDRRAIEDFSIPGICLMENAAIAATVVAADMLISSPSPSVAIIAGGGNNGGDGLAMARGLAHLGVEVEIALLKPAEELTGDAAINFRLLADASSIPVRHLHGIPDKIGEVLHGKAIIVDALLGTGFKGALSSAYRTVIDRINASRIPVLALDIPSGLNGDDGSVVDAAVSADATVTFAAVKTGLTLGESPRLCGRLYLGDIGAPTAAFR